MIPAASFSRSAKLKEEIEPSGVDAIDRKKLMVEFYTVFKFGDSNVFVKEDVFIGNKIASIKLQ